MLPKITISKNFETYIKDNRQPLEKLYETYLKLPDELWNKDVVYTEQIALIDGQKLNAPILCFSTKKTGQSLWLISGIHGEEPAGPNAISQSIRAINKLAKKGIPIVLFPLCNPNGYQRNWRYPDEYRDHTKGNSVGDSEHLLLQGNKNKPRRKTPASKQSDAFTKCALKILKTHPTLLTIDLHEDELVKENHYIYSHGVSDAVAKEIIRLFKKNHIAFVMNGKTRFGENIVNGFVRSSQDGSIDELLGAEKFFLNNQIIAKPASKTVIVIETPIEKTPIEARIKIHKLIIQSLENFWNIIKS